MRRKKFAAVVLSIAILFGLIPATSVSASQADDLINVAMGELHNTDGTKYGVSGAWCDAFIRWCANQANIPTSVLPRLYGTESYRSQSNYHARGTYSPKRGDIVLLDWDTTYSYNFDNISDHVEIVTGVHSDGVYTIGGNTSLSSNSSVYGVETKTRYNYKSWGQILGYLEVNYGSDPTPPSSAQISIDKESVRCGETFTITCSSDTSSQYYLAIFDADSGEKIIAENVANGIFKNSFQKAGKYNAYMTAYNSEGSVNSNWITFYVFGDPPTKAALNVNKTEMVANDTVTFKSSSDAYYVKIYISIFCNEILAYSGGIPYDFNYKPTSDGIYTAHITAYTHEGGVDSNWVTFYVGKYNVSYNANGGSGAPSAQTKIYGKNLTISNFVPTREGYTFTGWNTKPNGTGTSYLSSGIYNLNSNATLYAQWSQNSINPTTSTTATRSGSRIEVQTTISNLSQSASCVAAVYDSSGKLLGQTANDVDSSTNSVTAYFTNYSNASYVKVFLWDSLKGMKPLTNGEKVTL